MLFCSDDVPSAEAFLTQRGVKEDAHSCFHFAALRRTPSDARRTIRWAAMVDKDHGGAVTAFALLAADMSITFGEPIVPVAATSSEDTIMALLRGLTATTSAPLTWTWALQMPSSMAPALLACDFLAERWAPRQSMDLLNMVHEVGQALHVYSRDDEEAFVAQLDNTAQAGHLRLVTERDVEAVKALLIQCQQEEGWTPLSDAALTQRVLMNVGMGVVWEAAASGELLSVALVPRLMADVASIACVYTVPSARRKGLSRYCVASLTASLHSMFGRRYVQLYVERLNPKTTAMYRSIGFNVIETAHPVEVYDMEPRSVPTPNEQG